MAIRTRSDYFAGVDVGVKTDELARTSRLVSRLTGYHVQYNKAVVGRNAFAHEAGIHQHGVLADRETYEVIDASQVGQEAAQIVLGKHSGRHAFDDTLEKMGIHVQGDALNAAFVRFKELADKKIEITEADLEAIVAEELGIGMVHRYNVYELELHGGTATQAERARRARPRRRQGRSDRKRRRHDRRRDRRDLRGDRRARHGRQLPGVVGHRRFRRARRGRDHRRLRGPQGHRSRRRDRRGRGVGARVPQRGQQARAAAASAATCATITGGPKGRDSMAATTTSTCGANAEHAIDYLEKRDSIPRRAEAYECCSRSCPSRSTACSISGPATATCSSSCSTRGPARPASGSTSRTRCSTGRASVRRPRPAWRSRSHDLDEPLPADLGEFDVGRVELRDPPPRARAPARALRRGVRPPPARAGCSPTSSTSPPPPPGATRSSSTPSGAAPSRTIRPTNWSRSRPIWPGWTHCGFADGECLWKWRELAVVTGYEAW